MLSAARAQNQALWEGDHGNRCQKLTAARADCHFGHNLKPLAFRAARRLFRGVRFL